MSTIPCACNTLGNLSNVGSLAGFAIQGAVGLAVGYQTIGSPYTTLQETWNTLLNIKTHLKEISLERRQKIEAAAAMRQCRSLTDIEKEFQDLWIAHTELSQKYEQSSHFQRHFGQLRSLINGLQVDVKILLNDTWTTTRAQTIFPTPPPRDQINSADTIPAGPATIPSNPDANRESIELTTV